MSRTDALAARVRARTSAAAAMLATATLAGVLALTPVLAPIARADEKVFIELASPDEGTQVAGPVGIVEIGGFAGTGLPGKHEVLIAIDRSWSSWNCSGTDIDSDRRVGRRSTRGDLFTYYELQCTDPGDTILKAEIEAARRLIDRLNPETTQMGLLSFAHDALIHAPIGSTRDELRGALDRLIDEVGVGPTDFSAAIRVSRQEFARSKAARTDSERRYQSVLLLSDGAPTRPAPKQHAVYFAIEEAKKAAKDGVRIYGFALGPDAIGNREVYEEMTTVTGGDLVLVANPGDVTDFVPHISLTRLARVRIDNLSTSEEGRAVRLFPDGTFDGFSRLREGKNILRITAYGEDGFESVVDRRVFYTRVAAESEEDVAALQTMLRELQIRTLETELAKEARQKANRSRTRWLEVEVE